MIESMPRPKPPYLHRQVSRHGREEWYFRRGHGPRTRLPDEYGTPEFWSAYNAALVDAPQLAKATAKLGTLEWVIDRYRSSSAWEALSAATRAKREFILRDMITTAGDVPLKDIDRDDIVDGRERRKAKPHVANEYIKTVRHLFKWLSDPSGGNLITTNPTTGIKTLKVPNPDGYHVWTEQEIVQFEQYWKVGTKQRLALDIMQYTGISRGDVVGLGKQHLTNGVFTIRMVKERGDGEVYPPLLAPLAASIAATKCGELTYIVTKSGAPYMAKGFSNWFKIACRKAGLPHCCAHGVRKAAATRFAENGGTTNELKAFGGWSSDAMPSEYTRKANRKKLAAKSAHKLLRAQAENE